jgi:hypothetical protein
MAAVEGSSGGGGTHNFNSIWIGGRGGVVRSSSSLLFFPFSFFSLPLRAPLN